MPEFHSASQLHTRLVLACRLTDVYHVEGNPQSTEALVRACADTAASAVVLLPWSQQSPASEADDVVTAGMVDAGVLSVVRRLRALNSHVQVGVQHFTC